MSNDQIQELRELLNIDEYSTLKTTRTRSFGNARCQTEDHPLAGEFHKIFQGLGGTEKLKTPYPNVSLPQYDTTHQAVRKALLEKARKEHVFEYFKLPGAVVHGNIVSPEVADSGTWKYRGDLDSYEYNFGVDDASLTFDGIQLMEGAIAYLCKHFDDIVKTPDIALRVLDVFRRIIGALTDNKPDAAHFEIMDPILALFPSRKCNSVEELDFYPTFCPTHPHYEDRIKQWPKPDYDQDFRSDDLIGWLMTAAPSPVFDYFKPYTEHQQNFPITNEHLKKVPGFENDDIDQAMAEGRLFIVDFKDFHEETVAERNWDNYGARLHASISLFGISKESNALKTIAIQPTQTPQGSGFWEDIDWFFVNIFGYGTNKHPRSKIITAGDNYWAWQMAKNTVTTMASMAGVVDHLSSHVYLGSIPVAYFRNITEHHPLRPLLDTHLMGLLTNNHTGIFTEVGFPTSDNVDPYGDPFNGLLTGAIQHLSGFSSQTFLTSVLRRKSQYHFKTHSSPIDRHADPSLAQLKDFPQHDDNELAPIISEWVDGYIRLYYHSDQDVVDDSELQAFLYETNHYGMVRGFPDDAKTIEELVDTVSRIIYWMSVNHGFSSFVSFMKLGALGFYRDHPIDPYHEYSERDWLNICPPMNVGAGLFMFSKIFTDLPEDWFRSLGKYPKGQFSHDPNVYPYLDNFQSQLKDLDEKIRAKNRERRWSYDLRMPSTMTVSPWN
ncbi:Linoleate 9/13-lipoxygenase precursor [Grimontia celer]|uniref:Linoleate 9/13-lipoxygenase n=1 Tax=Grimontia celer TaxID=1796497 RepID=A0A128EVP8_9GAMM|nr:lipoxygenase family protein [Grimontia celer]CZF78668.1 Linoleate 9/13-lipoxygenase precursor [Grimontia celer]